MNSIFLTTIIIVRMLHEYVLMHFIQIHVMKLNANEYVFNYPSVNNFD